MGILESHFKSLLLIFGFFTALLLRVDIGGVSVAHSAPAGLVFAVCLTALSVAAGTKTKFDRKNIITGLLGGLLLIIPAAFSYKSGAQPYGSYLFWAAVVGFVALAEEAFLRGALFDVVKKRHNEKTAMACCASGLGGRNIFGVVAFNKRLLDSARHCAHAGGPSRLVVTVSLCFTFRYCLCKNFRLFRGQSELLSW
jgi:hypothetical protein